VAELCLSKRFNEVRTRQETTETLVYTYTGGKVRSPLLTKKSQEGTTGGVIASRKAKRRKVGGGGRTGHLGKGEGGNIVQKRW